MHRIWMVVVGTIVAVLGCRRVQVSEGLRVVVIDAPGIDKPYAAIVTRRLLVPSTRGDSSRIIEVSTPAFASADGSGQIYLYDEVERRIEIFDTLGRSLGIRGRAGGGPGEYQFPAAIRSHLSGHLDVTDVGKKAIVSFDPRGQVLAQRSFAGFGYPYGGIRIHGDTVIIHERYAEGESRVRVLRQIVGADTIQLGSIVLPRAPRAKFKCPLGTYTLNSTEGLLAPDLQWDARGGQVAVAVDSLYQVALFTDGAPTALIRRAISPDPVTPGDIESFYPNGLLFGPEKCHHPISEVAKALGVGRTVPLIRSIRFAPDGTIWITRTVGQERGLVNDVYSARGDYLGSATGLGLPIAFIRGGIVLSAELNSDRGLFALYLQRVTAVGW